MAKGASEKGDRPHLCEAPEGPLGQMGPASEKGDRPHLCEAPEGPFRQMGPVPFFGYAIVGDRVKPKRDTLALCHSSRNAPAGTLRTIAAGVSAREAGMASVSRSPCQDLP
jgi:hypothetical protein